MTEIIAECVRAVETDQHKSLPLAWRRRLWEAIGPVTVGDDGFAVFTAGLQRRVSIACHTVEWVLPIWNQMLSDNTLPRDMLDLAQGVMTGATRRLDAVSLYNDGWTRADNAAGLLYDMLHIAHPASFVGYAACRSLAVAIYDEAIFEIGEDVADDPYQFDPAEYAAAAFSGGFVRESTSSSSKRLIFWRHYLTEIVPKSIGEST